MLNCTDIAVIEEISTQRAAVSASPGFTWGRSGAVVADSYLLNDGVPSNVTGRRVPVTTGIISTVFIDSENIDTFDVRVFKHPSPFTTLAIVSIVADRGGTFKLAVPSEVTEGDRLGIQIINGSCKNPVIGLIIKGVV